MFISKVRNSSINFSCVRDYEYGQRKATLQNNNLSADSKSAFEDLELDNSELNSRVFTKGKGGFLVDISLGVVSAFGRDIDFSFTPDLEDTRFENRERFSSFEPVFDLKLSYVAPSVFSIKPFTYANWTVDKPILNHLKGNNFAIGAGLVHLKDKGGLSVSYEVNFPSLIQEKHLYDTMINSEWGADFKNPYNEFRVEYSNKPNKAVYLDIGFGKGRTFTSSETKTIEIWDGNKFVPGENNVNFSYNIKGRYELGVKIPLKDSKYNDDIPKIFQNFLAKNNITPFIGIEFRDVKMQQEINLIDIIEDYSYETSSPAVFFGIKVGTTALQK